MSDWSEIRRLQAAFEQVQASSTTHKLSERNCVEIVNKLIEMGLVSVIFTLDGKEYIVSEYLETEIRNELDSHRGRINIVDLQQLLNVDLSHIQKGVGNIRKKDSTLELIQGDLINSDYKESLCKEINEYLLQNGHVTLADLSTTFSLPLDYITTCVENSIGILIEGRLDKSGSGLLYTNAYVSRHKAMIRGTFSAVTRPTPVGPILLRGNYNENLFHSVLHELVSTSQLSGIVHGHSDKALYIPNIYTQMQNQWVDNFLASNGYLEYDAISRLGINDPLKYIKQRYKEKNLLVLESCCLGPSVLGEVEGCVEEVKMTGKWVDVLPILPTPCTSEDAVLLLQTSYGKDESLVLSGSVVAHVKFFKYCLEIFKPLLKEKAEKATLSSGKFLRQVSKEQLPSGGGGGGGEGKKGGRQKKGKHRRGREREEDDKSGNWEIKFMSLSEISNTLLDKMEDLPDEFANNLASHLFRPLQELFQEEARQVLAAQAEGEAGVQRKRHSELSDQVQGLWNTARLFEKGIDLFEGDTKLQLSKYLLRTLCTDMTKLVLTYIASDHNIKVPEDAETFSKERVKIIKQLPEPVKQLATVVNSSLTNKESKEFFLHFEKLCETESCGLLLKKLDKKKEKQLAFTHQQSLLDSLKEERDPAMVLHLTTVILFQQNTGHLLHAPGRLIPHIIIYLRKFVEPSSYSVLSQYQEIVVMHLRIVLKQTSKIEEKRTEDPEVVEVKQQIATSSEESTIMDKTPPGLDQEPRKQFEAEIEGEETELGMEEQLVVLQSDDDVLELGPEDNDNTTSGDCHDLTIIKDVQQDVLEDALQEVGQEYLTGQDEKQEEASSDIDDNLEEKLEAMMSELKQLVTKPTKRKTVN